MFYVLLSDGFEEIEALAVVDILRRASIETRTAGLGKLQITGTHGIQVVCDCLVEDIDDSTVDGVVLPGGMPGTKHLDSSDCVRALVDSAWKNDRFVCAICAAPSVLGHMGILRGRKAVCFPGFETELEGAVLSGEPVVTDGKIITAKGAGVAVDFGLEIVSAVCGKAVSEKIRSGIQCRG